MGQIWQKLTTSIIYTRKLKTLVYGPKNDLKLIMEE
nr:MAG TPA: hypothetical protein [Caudoviricetes sp.]